MKISGYYLVVFLVKKIFRRDLYRQLEKKIKLDIWESGCALFIGRERSFLVWVIGWNEQINLLVNFELISFEILVLNKDFYLIILDFFRRFFEGYGT